MSRDVWLASPPCYIWHTLRSVPRPPPREERKAVTGRSPIPTEREGSMGAIGSSSATRLQAGVTASLALIREGAKRRHLVASAPAKTTASPTHAFYIAVMMGPVTNECNRFRVKARGSAGNSCLRRSGPVQIPRRQPRRHVYSGGLAGAGTMALPGQPPEAGRPRTRRTSSINWSESSRSAAGPRRGGPNPDRAVESGDRSRGDGRRNEYGRGSAERR